MILSKLSDAPTNIHFESGTYHVYLLGGFDVSFSSEFDIRIKPEANSHAILVKPTLRFRSYENGKKAVRLFQFEISERGDHEVIVNDPMSVRVKPSMLFLTNLFLKEVDVKDCQLLFSRVIK